ncbi:hypothetical protein H9X77_15410, partial [Clostridium saudiense]|nr:hypothetical protein [Clostridium saudiense]
MCKNFISIMLITSIMFVGCSAKNLDNNSNNNPDSQSKNEVSDTAVGENLNVNTNVTTAEEAMKLLEEGNN